MIPKPSPDDFALLMKRFADARWIQASVIVKGKGSVDFTKHGVARMKELVGIFSELGALPPGQFAALLGLLIKFREDGSRK